MTSVNYSWHRPKCVPLPPTEKRSASPSTSGLLSLAPASSNTILKSSSLTTHNRSGQDGIRQGERQKENVVQVRWRKGWDKNRIQYGWIERERENTDMDGMKVKWGRGKVWQERKRSRHSLACADSDYYSVTHPHSPAINSYTAYNKGKCKRYTKWPRLPLHLPLLLYQLTHLVLCLSDHSTRRCLSVCPTPLCSLPYTISLHPPRGKREEGWMWMWVWE